MGHRNQVHCGLALALVLMWSAGCGIPSVSDAPPLTHFVNPVMEGADPWVFQHDGSYYMCQSDGNVGVSIARSDRLTEFGEKRVVWRAPESGPYSDQVWAPELHRIGNRWYIYVACSDGKNENHRMYTLRSATDDPFSEYEVMDEMYTGDDIATGKDNRWAIDGTPFEHDGQLYFTWSGWHDDKDVQYLYIAKMSNPWTISSNRVKLCENNDHLWERVDEKLTGRGLHEASQVLHRDGRLFMVYSCSGSWQPSYKLGMLELKRGGDPMNPAHWTKHPEPVFAPTAETFGTGHCSFVKSPDGREDWLLYHVKQRRQPGWQRAIHIQKFRWTEDGLPDFGRPIAVGVPLTVPSGQNAPRRADAVFRETFDDDSAMKRWSWYGYHGFLGVEDGAAQIGHAPDWKPVNDYRAGEKLVLRDHTWTDLSVTTRMRFDHGERDAGVLFRVQLPGVGYDAQRGYFAGLVPGGDRVVLGKTDGKNWQEIARAPHPVESGRWYELTVNAAGPDIEVLVDGKPVLRARDEEHESGTIGLRVVDSHARFDAVEIKPLKVPAAAR